MNGIINILKPTGMTSHDVVSRLRKILNTKKIGHTGTLDPNAAGVLPVCVGKATKLVDVIMEKKKSYRAIITLGKSTSTYDSFGDIIEIDENFKMPTEIQILKTIQLFEGKIDQIPPKYSALKINGKKMYDLARQGVEFEVKSRKVFIEKIKLVKIMKDSFMIDVDCSKGTYIRSLCYDLGRALGTCAYMSFLIRTKSGVFDLENCVTLEEFEEKKYMFSLDFPIKHFSSLYLINEKVLNKYLNGVIIEESEIINFVDKNSSQIRVYYQNRFIGLAKFISDKNIKSCKLLI